MLTKSLTNLLHQSLGAEILKEIIKRKEFCNVLTTAMKSVVLINTMRCSRKYPHSSHGSFFGLDPHPPPPQHLSGNSYLIQFLPFPTLASTPVPLGIFQACYVWQNPGGRGGHNIIFWNHTNTSSSSTHLSICFDRASARL